MPWCLNWLSADSPIIFHINILIQYENGSRKREGLTESYKEVWWCHSEYHLGVTCPRDNFLLKCHHVSNHKSILYSWEEMWKLLTERVCTSAGVWLWLSRLIFWYHMNHGDREQILGALETRQVFGRVFSLNSDDVIMKWVFRQPTFSMSWGNVEGACRQASGHLAEDGVGNLPWTQRGVLMLSPLLSFTTETRTFACELSSVSSVLWRTLRLVRGKWLFLAGPELVSTNAGMEV